MNKEKGFNLIQIIVATSIVLIIGVVVIFGDNVLADRGRARDARRWQDITAIAKAIELYNLENQSIPDDFSLSNLGTGDKFVLCSSAGSLTCDGQTESCVVVDNTGFLGKYLPNLPIDPEKSDTTDTGYYITRTSSNMLTIGSCESYGGDAIEFVAKASLPTYQVCGNGEPEGTEVCDEGNIVNAGCGNGVVETAGSYCNNTCTGYTTVSSDEWCDSLLSDSCFDELTQDTYYSAGYKNDGVNCSKLTTGCNNSCDACVFACQQEGGGGGLPF